jgi:predicted  nucleic acid-binding Zn-ribbon protein
VKIRIHKLILFTKQKAEIVEFTADVTFIHGPVSSGKSTTARLVDYCLGGGLERTPALRSEFVAVQLAGSIGEFNVNLERSAEEGSPIRVTWDDGKGNTGSVNAPLDPGTSPLVDAEVFNISDLLFYFAGVRPVKVRKSKSDPDAPLVRLSFRDVMWYCFLQQDELDSSFFQMHHPFKANKSRDVMRFITGLYSERMNDLESRLAERVLSQRVKRDSVVQIRTFMKQFELASESDFLSRREAVQTELTKAKADRDTLDAQHKSRTHALVPLRNELRKLSKSASAIEGSLEDIRTRITQQTALRSELITSKMKAARAKRAEDALSGVEFVSCPRCCLQLEKESGSQDTCLLCKQAQPSEVAEDFGTWLLDLNGRIDDLGESIARHKREISRLESQRINLLAQVKDLDAKLATEVDRYDSAFTSTARAMDSKVSELQERLRSLNELAQMPAAISALEKEAGSLQGEIDQLRSEISLEHARLVAANENIAAVAAAFKKVMIEVGFPGVYPDDRVILDPRNWFPYVVHGDQEWSFGDAGSGGKKTLFNVCYAIAVHRVALERKLPLPSLMMIDSPTKNITKDEDPELVNALYAQLYELARDAKGSIQFVIVDSLLVEPLPNELFSFAHRRMPPPLISYYDGP